MTNEPIRCPCTGCSECPGDVDDCTCDFDPNAFEPFILDLDGEEIFQNIQGEGFME